MESPEIPTILLLEIGKCSLETWRSLVFSVPKVARWSLEKDYQKHIQRHFTKMSDIYSDKPLWQEPPENHLGIYIGIRRDYKIGNKLHNIDGYALKLSNGTKYWYQNAKLHLEDGPAKEYDCGRKEW